MSDLILNLADCGLNELICGFSRGLSHKSGFVILSLSKDEPVEDLYSIVEVWRFKQLIYL